MKCCEITFSWGNYCIFTYFSCCLLELRTKDHRPRSPFFELQATLKARTCQITIIERNIKAILRAYFSSLRFDSGKIFKINIWNIFSRGLRTAYCTYSAVIKLVKRHHESPVCFTFAVILADLLDSSLRCFVWIIKFTFHQLMLVIPQVLKEKRLKNHGVCSFTNNKQTCQSSCQRFPPG